MDKLRIIDKDIDIIQLEFPENIRTRPGKAIGSTEHPDVILREAIDNSVDEIFGSTKANFIWIKTGGDSDYYIVADNGRGIPILWDTDKGKTKTELAVASLDAGSKFKKTIDTIATGQNGYGISCTNALSSKFIILSKVTEFNFDKSIDEVKNKYNPNEPTDLYYYLYYEKGIKKVEGCLSESDIRTKFGIEFPIGMSTIVAFTPDPTIFESTIAKYPKKNQMYVKAVTEKFYGKSIRIVMDGEDITNEFKPYKFEFVKRVSTVGYNSTKEATFYINFELDSNLNTVDYTGSVNSLVVNLGLHLNHVKDAWATSLKSLYNLNHNYLINGLKLNVIVMCGEVEFSSQTKERCVKLDNLTSSDCLGALVSGFKSIIKSNKSYFDTHVERLNEYAASLTKISTINRIKSMITVDDGTSTKVRSRIPTSVRDASSTSRNECELFIVEGKSASGSILQTRNSLTQAVIELRGVPMNSINSDLDELLGNEEMRNIISAIGVGVNEYYSLKNPRYGKIIIAADGDSDGGRIASLILGMIAKKMTFLIAEGMVYILDSPLYKQGEKYIYTTDDVSKELDKTKSFKRFKGLGELSSVEAKETIINKDTRKLIQINLDNVEYALELLTESYARKELMIESGILTDPYNLGIRI